MDIDTTLNAQVSLEMCSQNSVPDDSLIEVL